MGSESSSGSGAGVWKNMDPGNLEIPEPEMLTFGIQQNPKRVKVGTRIQARFSFVTAKSTFIFKRKSFSNDIPSLDEVFEDVGDLTSKYADKYYRKCYKIKNNIKTNKVKYLDEPYTRFKDKKEQQETFFIKDPHGNVLELKTLTN